MTEFRSLLSHELYNRKKKNPIYSLRAFARSLELSPSHLSNILNGRKPVTNKLALQLFEKLAIDKLTASELLEATFLGDQNQEHINYELITEEKFKVVSDWEHFAILGLAHLKDNQAQPKWIAQKLQIDVEKARQCLERLKSLNLITVENKKIKVQYSHLQTLTDVSSDAIKSYHRQNLELARNKIDEVPLKFREYSSITFDLDMSKLNKAKKLIDKFKKDLSEFLGSKNSSEVYTLSIQLFPLTKVQSNEN